MKWLRLGVTVFVFGLVSLLFVSKAQAATFIVNTVSDGSDLNPGNGICEVTLGLNDCGIRALIQETNALAGADAGNFNIPGAGVHTFTPTSGYPTILDQLTIHASTQPGASCGTLVPTLPAGANTTHTLLIEVNFSGFNGIGFSTFATGNIIRGFTINRITNTSFGIVSDGPSNTFDCNYIGTDTAGQAGFANQNQGVIMRSPGNVLSNSLVSSFSSSGIAMESCANSCVVEGSLIGSTVSGSSALANNIGVRATGTGDTIRNNIISGNNTGIFLNGFVNSTSVVGNYIGLGLGGQALGNTGDGVLIGGTALSPPASYGISIGGILASDRNIISANGGNGINISESCSTSLEEIRDSTIENNFIGVNTAGTVQAGYGNSMNGVSINEYANCDSIHNISIGGDGAGQPNIIAGNTQDGVRIYQSSTGNVFNNPIIRNSIYGNGNLGINLAFDSNNDGVANVDLGPNAINNFLMSYPATNANYYINRPTINAQQFLGNQVSFNYSLQANGVQNSGDGVSLRTTDLVGYRLDFYINSAGQDGAYAGYSQGKTHLGSFIVDGSETNATHTFTSPVPLAGTENVTATTTVLWQIYPDPPSNCGNRAGNGPPYYISQNGCN